MLEVSPRGVFRWYDPDRSNNSAALRQAVEKSILDNSTRSSELVSMDGYTSVNHAVWSCDFVLLAALKVVYSTLIPDTEYFTCGKLTARESELARFRSNLQQDLYRLSTDTRLTRPFIPYRKYCLLQCPCLGSRRLNR
jgi:hypothetical protein